MGTSSKVLTLLSVLTIAGVMPTIPTQAYEATSTQNSLAETREAVQLAQFNNRRSRPRCLDSDNSSAQRLLSRIESRTNDFRRNLDRALDRSRLNGSNREDNINQFVKDFTVATNQLRTRFRSGQEVRDELREVFRRADRIDRFMSRFRLGERAESDWVRIRQDLSQLERFSYRGDKCVDANNPDNGSIRRLLSRIESRTNSFKSALDRALDRSRLDGSNREDNINQFVRDFALATDRLRDRYNQGQGISNEVREVLGRANRIDRFMRRARLDDRAEREWASLRQDLDELSRIADK